MSSALSALVGVLISMKSNRIALEFLGFRRQIGVGLLRERVRERDEHGVCKLSRRSPGGL